MAYGSSGIVSTHKYRTMSRLSTCAGLILSTVIVYLCWPAAADLAAHHSPKTVSLSVILTMVLMDLAGRILLPRRMEADRVAWWITAAFLSAAGTDMALPASVRVLSLWPNERQLSLLLYACVGAASLVTFDVLYWMPGQVIFWIYRKVHGDDDLAPVPSQSPPADMKKEQVTNADEKNDEAQEQTRLDVDELKAKLNAYLEKHGVPEGTADGDVIVMVSYKERPVSAPTVDEALAKLGDPPGGGFLKAGDVVSRRFPLNANYNRLARGGGGITSILNGYRRVREVEDKAEQQQHQNEQKDHNAQAGAARVEIHNPKPKSLATRFAEKELRAVQFYHEHICKVTRMRVIIEAVKVCINGKVATVACLVDTGCPQTTIESKAARRLFDIQMEPEVEQACDVELVPGVPHRILVVPAIGGVDENLVGALAHANCSILLGMDLLQYCLLVLGPQGGILFVIALPVKTKK